MSGINAPVRFIPFEATIATNSGRPVVTGKAVLLHYDDVDGDSRKEWFPLSQLRDIELDVLSPQSVKVAEWCGKDKGLA